MMNQFQNIYLNLYRRRKKKTEKERRVGEQEQRKKSKIRGWEGRREKGRSSVQKQ